VVAKKLSKSDQKMKIALINNWPITSGVGRYAFTLFNLLKSLRSDIKIDHYFINREKRALYLISDKDVVLSYARRNPIIDNIVLMKYKLSNLFLDYRLGKLIPDDYDLYHITNQNMSFMNHYKNIGTNIITVHDLIYLTSPTNFMEKAFNKLVYKGLKTSDFLISISNSTKHDLIEYFNIPKEKIKVIPHGVDHDVFKPLTQSEIKDIYTKYNIDKGYQYILHIGSSLPRKNLYVLIMSIYKLIKKFNMKNIKLLKINHVDKNSIELVKRLRLERFIKIIEYVPEEDLPKIYNLADVFVFPSTYEGFGFPPLEAMACGTPVITSNTSSLPEVVGDAGIMLDPNDVDSFARAIYRVLTNEDLREDMIERGLKRAKKFSWERCAKETLDVYKEVVEG